MESRRRDFLSTLALGTLGTAGLSALDLGDLPAQQAASHWDLGWVRKLRGKYRAVFDVPEIEDGYGVWRAVVWRQQYSQVFGVPRTWTRSRLKRQTAGSGACSCQERYCSRRACSRQSWRRTTVAGT